MPRVSTWVPETEQAITRPVATNIIRELTTILRMDPDLQIVYPGASDQIAQAGSTLQPTAAGNNFFPSMEKVIVEVSESSDETRALSTDVLQKEYPSVFADPRVQTKIWPVYVHTEMVISFKYMAPNKTKVNQWKDDIRLRYSQGRVENLHEITYHYGIPYSYLTLLQAISEMKEAVAGYGENIVDWVTSHMVPNATNIVTLSGGSPQLVIAETQEAVIGWFDFTLEPAPAQKDNDTGPWVATFEYHVAYDKPVQCGMEYPLMVHNQLIDQKFRGSNIPSTLGQRKHYQSLSRQNMNHLTPRAFQKAYPSLGWYRVPSFDDWVPKHTARVTANVMTFMLQVDDTDPYLIMDLQDLGDYNIDPDVLGFLATEGQYAGTYRDSVFYFSLYETERDIPNTTLTWGNDFNIRSTLAMDKRKTYHLRWAALTDLTMLNTAAQNRLCANGRAGLKILMSLMGDERLLIPLPKLVNGAIGRSDFLAFANQLNIRRRGAARILTNTGVMMTVGTYYITTARNRTGIFG